MAEEWRYLEVEETHGNGRFVQRDVYAQYHSKNGKIMCNTHITPNWRSMRSIADISKLGETRG